MPLADLTTWPQVLTDYVFPALSVTSLISMTVVGCGLTLLGMPGNWLILLVAIAYDVVIRDGSRIEMGERILIVIFVLAVAGEALELLTGAAGVAKKGGSKRGAAGALLGSLVGSVLGVGMGMPIPIIGPVVGMMVFAGIGALVGAAVAEHSTGRDLREAIDIGFAAMVGRVVGTLAKSLVGVAMLLLILLGLII